MKAMGVEQALAAIATMSSNIALAVGIENVVGGERDVTLVRVRHGA